MRGSFFGRMRRRFFSGINRILILLVLGKSREPIYGYQIAKVLKRLSEGRIVINMSTLYSILRRMESMGLVRSIWRRSPEGPPRRCYIITEQGRRILEEIDIYLRLISKMIESGEDIRSASLVANTKFSL